MNIIFNYFSNTKKMTLLFSMDNKNEEVNDLHSERQRQLST